MGCQVNNVLDVSCGLSQSGWSIAPFCKDRSRLRQKQAPTEVGSDRTSSAVPEYGVCEQTLCFPVSAHGLAFCWHPGNTATLKHTSGCQAGAISGVPTLAMLKDQPADTARCPRNKGHTLHVLLIPGLGLDRRF